MFAADLCLQQGEESVYRCVLSGRCPVLSGGRCAKPRRSNRLARFYHGVLSGRRPDTRGYTAPVCRRWRAVRPGFVASGFPSGRPTRHRRSAPAGVPGRLPTGVGGAACLSASGGHRAAACKAGGRNGLRPLAPKASALRTGGRAPCNTPLLPTKGVGQISAAVPPLLIS